MAVKKQCPKCRKYSAVDATECDHCAVQFADLKRQQPREPKHGSSPELCTFNDRGASCTFKAIMLVNGSWCCREHGYKLGNYAGMEGKRGNELPSPDRHVGAEDWHRAMTAFLTSGGHSSTHHLIDGKSAKRPREDPLRPVQELAEEYIAIEREPGCDDEATA